MTDGLARDLHWEERRASRDRSLPGVLLPKSERVGIDSEVTGGLAGRTAAPSGLSKILECKTPQLWVPEILGPQFRKF